MAAYCREFRQLEDKFNSLELNQILRRLNKAGNMMAMMTSSQELVLMGVFASDQHKPSVRYEGLEQASDSPPILGSEANQPSAPSDLDVMELEEDPMIAPNPLFNLRMPYLDYLLHDTLPMDKMEAQQLARHAKSFVLMGSELYKQSHTGIQQRSIPIEWGETFAK
ncbi:uncharacterized protein [Miscanthus floridulus]|uniref:uncharacterized protein n=1 Tax=Miscanthus floridulus TaxID=154761 RepID=UPI0034596972